MKQQKKKMTLMIVPHNGKEIRSLELSIPLLVAGCVLIAGAVFSSAFFSYKYFVARSTMSRDLAYIRDKEAEYGTISESLQQANDAGAKFSAELNKTGKLLSIPHYDSVQGNLEGDFAQALYVNSDNSAGSDKMRSLLTMSEKLNKSIPILQDINTSLKQQTELMRQIPVFWPVPGAKVTMEWGPNIHPIYGYWYIHKGIDLAAMTGAPVYSSAEGVVTKTGFDPGYGFNIYVSHKYGFKTHYSHLSAISVSKGQHVKQGQRLGAVGSTGLATGSHLDFQLYLGEDLIDPGVYLRLLNSKKYTRPTGNR